MAENVQKITDFVHVLGEASLSDLQAVDQEINRLKQQMNALRVLRKVLEARIEEVPEPRKPTAGQKPAGNGKSTVAKPVKSATMWERRRQLIAEICVRGPLRYGEIEKILKISSGGVLYSVINYPAWFIKENDRWNITNEARQELAKVRVGQNEEESE